MPVVEGNWVPNSSTNQRMRLVLDWSTSNVNDSTTRVSWTVRVEAGYSFNDSSNSFTRGGSWPVAGRSVSINVPSNGSQVLESSSADAGREYGGGSRTLTFSLTGIEYVGVSQTATVSASIPIPARPISAPLAPSSISVTRVSDTAHTINWAASTSDARPIWNFNLQWQEMGGAWSSLGNPSGSQRSWPSRSQQPNRAYRYRIRTSNSAGQSSWVESAWIYNTPAAATSVTAARSGDNVLATWTNNVWSGYGSNATHDVQVSSRVGSGSWSGWSNAASGLDRTVSSRSISGLDLTREWRARIVTRVPGRSATSSASGSVAFYNPPPAPTLSGSGVTRVSDSDNRPAWAFSGSGTSAATSFTIQRWMQTDQVWRTVGNATGGSRSWTDTVSLWDNRARWRIRASNPAGSSDWVYSPYQPGTPRGSTTPTVTRSGANAILSWSNQARYSESISLWASSAPAGTTDWAPWAALTGHTGLSPSTTQRTITGLDSDRIWRFQIRTHAVTASGATLTGNSGISATLQLPAAPAVPTPLAPVTVQAEGAVTFRWRHNPIDGSPQQGYELQFRFGGGSWVTRTVLSTVEAHTEPMIDVGVLEWRVATRGQHTSYSPYSGTVTVEVAHPPAATITHPTGTIQSNRVTLTWDYSDAQGAAQAWWMAELALPGGATEQRQGTTQRSARFDTIVPDGTEVEVTLWVTSGTGLQSEPTSVTQLVHYLRPAQPVIYAAWAEGRGEVALAASEGGSPLVWIDPEQGLVSLPGTTLHEGDGRYTNDAVTFIDHGEGRITVEGDLAPTELVRFERSDDEGATWLEVSGPVTLTDAVSDWMVPLNRAPLYRALAISDLEVEVASAPVRVSTATNRVWLHTLAGDSLSLEGNVELSPTIGADSTRVRYLGDVYPTAHHGIGMDEQVAVSGTWFGEDAELTDDDPIRQVLGRAVWFRDPSGRAWWASIDSVGGRQPWSRVREASFTAVRSEAPRG